MFYFSHAIADAFGAPDAAGTTSLVKGLRRDLGGWQILRDAISLKRVPSEPLRGAVKWSTMFDTALSVFLGVKPQDLLEEQNSDKSPRLLESPPTIAAVQYGSLAVIAPWLDISQPLSCKRSFRFEVVQGQLALDSGQVDGQHVLRGISDEMCVIETPPTEDVSEFNLRTPPEVRETGSALRLNVDKSDENWDWILVPADPVRKNLLLRVASGDHSRMVDPSNALRRLSCMTELPACAHGPVNHGVVPENALVELHGFGELLGRWGGIDYGTDDNSDGDSDPGSSANLDFDSDVDSDDAAGGPRTPTLETRARPEPPTILADSPLLVRMSHALNSDFKFNTALALSQYNSLVAHGHCCISCSLRHAVKDKQQNRFAGNYFGARNRVQFYVINRVNKNPARTTPLAIPVRRAGQAIEEGHRRRLADRG
jgi:hypothetical protein